MGRHAEAEIDFTSGLHVVVEYTFQKTSDLSSWKKKGTVTRLTLFIFEYCEKRFEFTSQIEHDVGIFHSLTYRYTSPCFSIPAIFFIHGGSIK